MNWTITVKPNNVAKTSWSWTAVRDDQETVRSGGDYPTSQGAVIAASSEAQEFEDGEAIIKDATFQVTFVPSDPPEVPA